VRNFSDSEQRTRRSPTCGLDQFQIVAEVRSRVSHHGFYIGKARDWDGVARLGVDIGDLRET
jgi:hypothetical protein